MSGHTIKARFTLLPLVFGAATYQGRINGKHFRCYRALDPSTGLWRWNWVTSALCRSLMGTLTPDERAHILAEAARRSALDHLPT